MDHLGLLIAAAISSGNCGDRDGLEALLYFNQGKYPNKLFADRGYKGREFREKLKDEAKKAAFEAIKDKIK